VKVLDYTKARMEHQKRGERLAFAEYLSCLKSGKPCGYGFFYPPGTGKSAAVINTVRRIILHSGEFKRILILCPPVVVPNWKDEILKFSKIETRRITLLTRSGKKCAEAMDDVAFDHMKRKRQHIFITNYEKLVTCDSFFQKLREWEPQLVILDESHRLKSWQAKRTKKVDQLVNPSVRRSGPQPERPIVFALTGTFILNSLMDVYSQFLLLDGGDSFGDNFFAFRARYFRMLQLRLNAQRTFPKWVPLKGSADKIGEIVARKSISVKLEDCLDLPPLIKKKVFVDMSPEQAKAYAEMKTQLITYIESQACVAQMAITKALRLMQIASGYLQLEGGQTVQFKDTPKLTALEEILSDVAPGRKVIIWSVFKENYKMIRDVCKKLNLPMVEIHGDVSQTAKREAEKAFQNDPAVRVLSGNPGAGGIGINLTAGCYTIYYSSNFSKENRDQSGARDYRKGSEKHASITHVDLLVKGTIEEEVLKKLDAKDEISLSILRNII